MSVVLNFSKKSKEPVEMNTDPSAIRNFVKDLYDVDEKIKEARAALKEETTSNSKIKEIDEEIKDLKDARKKFLEENQVISDLKKELDDFISEKKDIIDNAKTNGIPSGEIKIAITALKKDLDMEVSTSIYANIADLVSVD
jgi:predicted nuclease with TOPRIM domain